MDNDFIFELGCEELPSGSVWPLSKEFADHLLSALDKAELTYGEVKHFASPRRIAIVIHDLQAEQPHQVVTRRGPAVSAAFDSDGNPTPALIGFAKSCGVEVQQLTTVQTEKGDWMVYQSQNAGRQTKELLPQFISQTLSALPIAKPMRWGAGHDEFARPVHWAVMLYGNEVIEHSILGIKTNRLSRGHRFHCPQYIEIKSAKDYESQMKEAFVVADFAERRAIIKEQVEKLAQNHHAKAIMPDELLDEVASIVEWPCALMANFEEEFLEVPAEALIASMQSHQKCFALTDKSGQLLPHFIAVSNIESINPTQVILGNEKVMRARLSDAAFFYRQDKKQSLSHHIAATEQVVFQVKLGSLYDKSMRIKSLMSYLSQAYHLSLESAERAAELSKCDLMTGMVGEFPELQGLMGYYYALNDGEHPAVAQALNEQYMPRFAADVLPKSELGTALSIADRIDTLVGIFAIGQKPSGVRDPFKLRRHALALVRMLIASPAAINLSTLINEAVFNYGEVLPIDHTMIVELRLFILERLNSYYQNLGVPMELVWAVRACEDEWLYDLDKRLQALKTFIAMPEAQSLSTACKRVHNLLNQAGNENINLEINEKLLIEAAEKELYHHINTVSQLIEPLYRSADYTALLTALARLKEPVDTFFEQVMVMVDDLNLKKNRLSLLLKLQTVLKGVADISLLQLI